MAFSLGTAASIALWLARDTSNIARYGPQAPRYAQLIWVRPADLNRRLIKSGKRSLRHNVGQIIGGDWDLHVEPMLSSGKVHAAVEHWRDGIPWEDTGAYDIMMKLIEAYGSFDGCRTFEDVVARYKLLDEIFSVVLSEGRLRPRHELAEGRFRELGGVGVHIDRRGSPIWGFSGSHRLAMAHVLELPRIPAMLAVVHQDAMPNWRSRLLDEA